MIARITISFIVLSSLSVLINGQTCRNVPLYSRCSINPDCGCLPFSSLDDQSGICAYLHLNVSKLRTCHENHYYCDQPYTVCIQHPNISIDQPICYPTGMATFDICPPLYSTSTPLPPIIIDEICVNVSWATKGVQVAGSQYGGAGLHQLRGPTAIVFDLKTNLLYIADNDNSRIVTWGPNATRGSIVAGDNGKGNRTDQFGWIGAMIMDPKDGSLIMCDGLNKRIVRWQRRAQQGIILIENLACSGLALDDQGLLYVSEHNNHRISRWLLGENITQDAIVAGGNGKGNKLNQLYEPMGIFVDHNRTVYISDYQNDRIVKWTEGATEGIVLGKVRWPRAVHVDSSNHIYAIDGYYSKVMRWTSENTNGTVAVGEKQYTLSQAYGFAFDRHGNMFVASYGQGRVDRFDIDRSACL